MSFNIGIVFGNAEKIDALETMEDLQNELSSWGLESRRLKNDRIKCGNTIYSFINLDEISAYFSKSGFFNKIYMCQSVREYEFQITLLSENISYHPYPFQCLIDLVINAKENELQHTKKACVI